MSFHSMSVIFLIKSTETNSKAAPSICFGSDVASGIRITYHGKYPQVENHDDDLFSDIGLDSGLHPCVVCYVKYRMFEDLGDMQKAMYFRKMFTDMFNKYPLRKSGVRRISVPRM